MLSASKQGSAEFGSVGATFGAKTHTLGISELPSHRHNVHANTGAPSPYSNVPNSTTQALDVNEGTVVTVFWSGSTAYGIRGTGATGGNSAHNNIQPTRSATLVIRV